MAFAQLKGKGDIHHGLDYVLKYKVGSETGKAKIEFDDIANTSQLQVTLVSTTTGKAMEHDFKILIEQHPGRSRLFQFQWDIKLEGTSVQKAHGILSLVDN